MATLQTGLKDSSQRYIEKLELFNKNFEKRVIDFFKSEYMKCLVLETKDTRTRALKIRKIIKELEPPLSDKYGDKENQIFLKWDQLIHLIEPSKVIPKLGNLLVLELCFCEPEYNNADVLALLLERVNMIPSKKAIFIFSHQDCPDTYLKEIDIDAFLKIDEFNNEVTSLTDTDHKKLLYQAAGSGRENHISALLKRGAKVNEPGDDGGNTALHVAAEFGNKHLVTKLLQNGALIFANESGDTPLHIAAKYGHDNVILTLLEYDSYFDDSSAGSSKDTSISRYIIDINARNIDGRTALHLAADFGQSKVANVLLNYGANVNCRDNDDCTPLHFAASFHESAIVNVLIERGAQIDVKNKLGETPLDIARQHNYVHIEELLTPRKKGSRLSVSLGMI